MICYKDRSYCAESPRCGNEICHRHLSKDEEERAKTLGLPIAFADFSVNCGMKISINTD